MRSMHKFILICAVLALAAPAWAAKETYTDTAKLDAKAGMTLEVEVAFFDVDIEVHDSNSVDIDVFMEIDAGDRDRAEEIISEYKPTYEETNKRIIIESKSKKKWRNSWKDIHRSKAKMTVKIPKGMHLDLSTASGDINVEGDMGDAEATANLASGDLHIDGAMSELDLNTASGDVVIRLTRPVRILEVNAASGDIEVFGGAGRVNASTASGDVTVEDIQGTASLSTASGNIEASWTEIDDDTRIRCSAASGDIRLTLPENAGVSGYLDTSSGSISADYPGYMNKRRDRFEFEGPGAELEVSTASGDVIVKAR
jgi:DUF4097 and DUF4098 domain-containing protein YvlB